MAPRLRILVLASGNGSNFQAVIDSIRDGRLPQVEVAGLICDNPSAPVIDRARKSEIPATVLDPTKFESSTALEAALIQAIESSRPDYILLAGFMRILSADFVRRYPDQILNIHPSLLPAFKGRDSIRRAWEHGVAVTGCTLHFIDEKIDNGAIVDQVAVLISGIDSLEALETKIHQAEHELIVQTLGRLSTGQVIKSGRRIRIQPQ